MFDLAPEQRSPMSPQVREQHLSHSLSLKVTIGFMAKPGKLSKKLQRSRARAKTVAPKPPPPRPPRAAIAAAARAAERQKLLALRSEAVVPKKVRAPGANAATALNALTERLPTMPFADIIQVWKNALRMVDASGRGPARQAIAAIEQEWKRRGALPFDPDDFFSWPSTAAPGGTGKLSLAPDLGDGMLTHLGYRVGRTQGEPAPLRRAILRRVFEGELPPALPRPRMAEWGLPGSVLRLHKLAESLAAFARNAKRKRSAHLDDAISSWEADLRFLYDEYYIGRFHFGWPDTRV